MPGDKELQTADPARHAGWLSPEGRCRGWDAAWRFDKLGGAKARRSDVQDCPIPQGSRSNGGMPAVVMEGGIDLSGALTPHSSDDDLPPGDRKGLEGRVGRVSRQ
jgi:hypothetical protein